MISTHVCSGIEIALSGGGRTSVIHLAVNLRTRKRKIIISAFVFARMSKFSLKINLKVGPST